MKRSRIIPLALTAALATALCTYKIRRYVGDGFNIHGVLKSSEISCRQDDCFYSIRLGSGNIYVVRGDRESIVRMRDNFPPGTPLKIRDRTYSFDAGRIRERVVNADDIKKDE